MMNRRAFIGGLLGAGGALAGVTSGPADAQGRRKRVLIVSHAAGFRHSSIPTAAMTVHSLAAYTGAFEVAGEAPNAQALAEWMTADRLKGIDLVFFANTTGNLGIPPEGRKAFYDWIYAGGGYAGVHSASDTYHGDYDYLNLVRGEFLTHGPQVRVTVYNQDPTHPACKGLPDSFEIFDEIYLFKNWDRGRVHVLLSMKKHPNRDEPGDFPVAWTNRVGQGRMFYTSLGHREDVYMNPVYLEHLKGGLLWALGLAPGDDRPGNPVR